MRNYNTAKNYFESILINFPRESGSVSLNIDDVKIGQSYEDSHYIGLEGISTTS